VSIQKEVCDQIAEAEVRKQEATALVPEVNKVQQFEVERGDECHTEAQTLERAFSAAEMRLNCTVHMAGTPPNTAVKAMGHVEADTRIWNIAQQWVM